MYLNLANMSYQIGNLISCSFGSFGNLEPGIIEIKSAKRIVMILTLKK